MVSLPEDIDEGNRKQSCITSRCFLAMLDTLTMRLIRSKNLKENRNDASLSCITSHHNLHADHYLRRRLSSRILRKQPRNLVMSFL